MQTDKNIILSEIHKEHKIPENLLKDLTDFVFSEVNHEIRYPEKLILSLAGIGRWVLRKKRMIIGIEEFFPRDIKKREEYSTDKAYDDKMYKRELFTIFEDRLLDYQEYIKDREQIKNKRREFQKNLDASKGKEQSSEPS